MEFPVQPGFEKSSKNTSAYYAVTWLRPSGKRTGNTYLKRSTAEEVYNRKLNEGCEPLAWTRHCAFWV